MACPYDAPLRVSCSSTKMVPAPSAKYTYEVARRRSLVQLNADLDLHIRPAGVGNHGLFQRIATDVGAGACILAHRRLEVVVAPGTGWPFKR
jgi:hypothetical protein